MGILDNILGKKASATTQTTDPLVQKTAPGTVPPAPLNAVPPINPLNTTSPLSANNNPAGQVNATPALDPLAQADSLLGQTSNINPGVATPSQIATNPLNANISTVPATPNAISPLAPVVPEVPPLDLSNNVASPLSNSANISATDTTTPPAVNNESLMNTSVTSTSTLNKTTPVDQPPAIDLLAGAGMQTAGGKPSSNRSKQLIGEIEAKLSELKRLVS